MFTSANLERVLRWGERMNAWVEKTVVSEVRAEMAVVCVN